MTVISTVLAAAALAAVIFLAWRISVTNHRLHETLARTFSDNAKIINDVRNALDENLNAFRNEFSKAGNNITQQLSAWHGTIKSVQEGLGEVRESSQQTRQLASDIKKLEEILRPPKLRGVVGEILLENALGQILPAGCYDTQYDLAGKKVDFVVKIGEKLVPIDAKFPMESFERYLAADENNKPAARREFVKTVKDKIDGIAVNYIRPDLDTYDFALMYLPSENIYYEAAVADADLYQYAADKKVFPVSPATVYIYLQTVALGLRGLALERKADLIRKQLQRLADELREFEEKFNLAARHLRNAQNALDAAGPLLSHFIGRLKHAGDVETAEQTLPKNSDTEEPLFS